MEEVTDPTEIATMLENEDHAMGSQVLQHEGTDSQVIQRYEDIEPEDIGALATVAGIDVSSHQSNVD